MSQGPTRHLDALLNGCLEALGRIGARVSSLSEGETDVADRLLSVLRGAVAEVPCGEYTHNGSGTAGSVRHRVVASDACPACGSSEVGTVESVPGVALSRISEGRLEWTGQTEIDWNGSETLATDDGPVLACASCGERWVHPSLVDA